MAPVITHTDITGLILAGGRGSRMNDHDKGLQILGGIPLAQHALRRLQPQVGSTLISANRNLERYSEFGIPVLADSLSGYAGPLAGLQTGLAHCSTPWLACVPCDSPTLPHDLVARLAQAVIATDAELAYATTGSGATHRSHPVFCLMRSSVLPSLQAYLGSGGRKVSAWQARLKSAEVHFADAGAFCNINSLADLRVFEEAQS